MQGGDFLVEAGKLGLRLPVEGRRPGMGEHKGAHDEQPCGNAGQTGRRPLMPRLCKVDRPPGDPRAECPRDLRGGDALPGAPLAGRRHPRKQRKITEVPDRAPPGSFDVLPGEPPRRGNQRHGVVLPAGASVDKPLLEEGEPFRRHRILRALTCRAKDGNAAYQDGTLHRNACLPENRGYPLMRP